jgi:signal transduction histidine kinase
MQEPASSTGPATGQALILLDPGTFALVQASRRVQEVLGFSDARLGEMALSDIVLHPPPGELGELLLEVVNGSVAERTLEVLLREKSGRTIPAELLLIRKAGPEHQPLAAVVSFGATPSERDDVPRLEPGDAKFVDFAGRLGHDLNNLLSTVIGSLGLIREDGFASSSNEGRQLADDALSASRECADLVDRLMTAAGKQFLRPQRVAANTVIQRLTPLLMQTLPENIDLEVTLDSELPELDVDPDRLEAAILDLVVNAREAMPGGGKLVIRSGVGELSNAPSAVSPHRHYVQITVGDAGAGIPAELRNRVLEPLFTTKSSGTGRGLGLSMVNGFVQQSHGTLSVDSESGQGTRVTLNFPPAG